MAKGETLTAIGKTTHFFAGMSCALIALPFGIIAAAIAPIVIGFAVELYHHMASRTANPANFAWMIAGAATFVVGIKLMGGTL
ncbi:MAG: hypothetical protein ABIQ90_03830 [Polaromonas sp.]